MLPLKKEGLKAKKIRHKSLITIMALYSSFIIIRLLFHHLSKFFIALSREKSSILHLSGEQIMAKQSFFSSVRHKKLKKIEKEVEK